VLPPLPAPPRHETILFSACDDCGRHDEIFSVHCPAVWMESEWLLVHAPRHPFLDLREEHLEIPRVIVHRRFLICPSLGRRSTEEDCVKVARVLASLLDRYGLTRHPTTGIWGRGSQCVSHLGFVVDTKRGMFGVPAQKLEGVSERARMLLARARVNRGRVPAKEVEVFIGKFQGLRLALPDTAYCIRALYTFLPKREGHVSPNAAWGGSMAFPSWGSRHGDPFCCLTSRSRRCAMAVLSHPALRRLYFWRDLPQSLRHRSIWPKVLASTATVQTDA
jgi:hypothetical protein